MIEMYYMANGSYPRYWGDLDIDIQGCQEGTYLYDLICKNIRIDLNENHFMGWDSNKRTSSTDSTSVDKNVNFYYYFLNAGNSVDIAGKFRCQGMNDNGKKLCKGLCGTNSCLL